MDVASSSAAAMNGVAVDHAARGRPADPDRARGCAIEERAQPLRRPEPRTSTRSRDPAAQTRAAGQVSTRRLRHGDREDPPARPVPHHHRRRVSRSPVRCRPRCWTPRRARLDALAASLPPGYKLAIGGEEEEQNKGFVELAIVMFVLGGADLPGAGRAVPATPSSRSSCSRDPARRRRRDDGAGDYWARPSDSWRFLGIISLIGVIVSHVIVLFDFIEEMHAQGRAAARRAARRRHRPPAAGAHHRGGDGARAHPARRCTAARSGSRCASADRRPDVRHGGNALLVPLLYAVSVLDLKVVRWDLPSEANPARTM